MLGMNENEGQINIAMEMKERKCIEESSENDVYSISIQTELSEFFYD